MGNLLFAARSRVLPALLTALGVMLLTAGLLTYADPTTAGEPSVAPTPEPTPIATASPEPSASPSDEPSTSPSSSPSTSPSSTPEPTVAIGVRVATRVVVPALDIDMPVIKGPPGYPPCDVAMYLTHEKIGQPGEGRATYLFAHAREGMFLPLLETPGADMKGMLVEVYTSDDQLYLYEIVSVRRNQTSLERPLAATEEELWLQTSEGPRGTPGKTQILAKALSVGPADHDAAHPTARPVDCG